tara:strand:- start:328 stop:714 length:387 start_codon:yes stop_codon:yes gene_type:complete
MNLSHLLVVALGGATGAVLRYSTNLFAMHLLGRHFPWGTLIANVVGSLVMGIMWRLLQQDIAWVTDNVRLFLMVGLLGAFTTFSTFSMDSVQFFMSENWLKGCYNVALNLFLCLLAAYCGAWLTQRFL